MGALLDAVPAGGADHTEHHRDLATAVEAVDLSGYQPLDSDLTAIAALTTTSYGRGLLSLANQAALQAEAATALDSDLTDIAALTPSEGNTLSYASGHWTAAAPGGGGTPGVDYPTSATVTLSSADILDLHNTPITLVAAPGAGKWINIHRASAYHDFGTTAYTTDDANGPAVGVSGTYNIVVGNLTTTEDYIDAKAGPQEGNTAMVNAAVQAFGNVTTFTLGDGTLTVTVWYTIEDVPA